ncbi:8924_t:CDS:2, partial [Cetraspora pellucida]
RCNGDLIIKKRRMQTLFSSESISQPNTNKNNGYFVGCTSWKYGITGHRYIPLTEAIDRHLLKNLIDGMYAVNNNGNPIEANLIHLLCNVTFYRLTPVDLIKCPFVVLVSVGEHTHPPPPLSHIPEAIKDRNLIRAHFGVDILSEIHASLNNLDQLRYLVNRVQQAKNPQGQGILGITYNFWKNKNNICDYIQQLSFFDSGHIMVLCMTKEQAIKLYEMKYFQMDLTYKPVQGEINVFELNKYDKNHQIILTFARIFTNISNADAYRRMFLMIIEAIKYLTNKSVKIQHIHDDSWCCILGDLDIAQAKGLGLALSTINSSLSWIDHLIHIFKTCPTQLMQNILTAESFEEIQLILNEISLIDEAGIEEIEERKKRLREAKLLNYEKARRLGIEKELGYDE